MSGLNAYFDRIGFHAERKPTREVLRQLHRMHTESIPFENLSPLLGLGVPLDIPALLDKFTRQGRGGYCFEHNLLFQHVLQSLGFRTRALAARVRWNVPDDRQTARTHMLLLVQTDGEAFIADVGFGGMTLTAPLRFEHGIVQETPHGPFRLLFGEDFYTLQAGVNGEWKNVYAFDLQPQLLPDYEVTNWYLSNHPLSHFVTGLIAAMPASDGRHALRNGSYTFYGLDGRQEQKRIRSVEALRELLEQCFRLRMPDLRGSTGKLEQLLRADD